MKLDYQGKPFLVFDRLDFSKGEYRKTTPGTEFALASQPGKSFIIQNGEYSSIIANGVTGTGIAWARETAVSKDTAEISYALYIPPEDYGLKAYAARLKFYVPVEALAGCKYECYIGMHRSGRPRKSGKLTGTEPEGEMIAGHVRHIQFTGKTNIYIDFCPVGVWGVFNNDPAVSYKAHLFREGEYYVFILPDNRARYGARFLNKVVLREGIQDMDELHVVRVLHYAYPQPALQRIQFTSGAPVAGFAVRKGFAGWEEEFKPFATALYNSTIGLGWCSTPNGEMYQKADKNIGPLLSSGFHGKGRAVFRMDHPNAMVIANVIFSGDVGPYDVDVSVNGSKARQVSVADRVRQTVRIPCTIKDGKIEIAIEGKDWLLSGIVPQYLLGEKEDYQFQRTWWASGKAPWTLDEFNGPDLWKTWPLPDTK